MEMLAKEPQPSTAAPQGPSTDAEPDAAGSGVAAEAPPEPTSTVDAGPTAPAEPKPVATGPSGMRLAITSIAAFVFIVAIGGIVGWLVDSSSGDVDPAASVTTAAAPDALAVADEPIDMTSALPETVLPATSVAPPVVAPIEPEVPTPSAVDAPSEPASEIETPVLTSDDVTITEPVIVVQGVVELNLPIGDDVEEVIAPPESQTNLFLAPTLPADDDVEFVELPKAVYDRFTLRVGDSFAINIAANDKIGGDFDSVELTGLGEIAPGFSLNSDGTLAGTAIECGQWKAQYALNSTNPAIGTSWIDLTVSGCDDV